ncbi:putative enhancer of polycomb protein [Helianthus annuus]|uniref:Enhancer of polycomb-like protein n=1 Tax=Helianthus annuus TaxID=4232 RepID=A0A251UB23_HELAN|nr:uncharacterized protein LOC110868232 [Helianthus annuus]KAF5799038.1 putative enhancer of polycomb protein [Helianthus annuus]KAJ0563505.1 putative enhancer of polycomb protein [Helianthus annuus]KAJ0731599.1 putative enhancer of polycomb protein [Helianthus annuus]KAJ0908422.1 putative enhancer of polycomb protein [Helianthus annuus]
MKRSTRSFVHKVLRSRKRLFADRYEDEDKRLRIISLSFFDTQVNKFNIYDHNLQIKSLDLEKSKKVSVNGTNEVVGIELVDDNASRVRRFGIVYTRKRKRCVSVDSRLKFDVFDESCGLAKVYERKKKKVRVSLESGFGGKYVLKKGPGVFAVLCGCESDENGSGVYRFSCFVSLVLRYLRLVEVFSWRQFSSFLELEPNSSVYLSIGSRFVQDSTCTTSHGLFKVFGSIHSIPSFTMNFNSLPFCFLYIHSNLHLKHSFLSYLSINRPTDKNDTNYDPKTSSIATLKRDPPLVKLVVAKKARSARKRIPRVSLFNNLSQRNGSAHVESTVPVPGVREIVGYAEDDYVPFTLPESYISSKGDEASRTLEKSCPVYDMDSDDEQWLKKLNHENVSEDVFEKVIDAFERGIYCSPHDYSEAASAVDRCLELAPKEVLEDVYSYWMTKRKKKRSALIRVFQCYKQKRVRRRFTSTVLRKKRSFRRRASQRFAEKPFDFKKAMLNDEKLLEESKAYIKVHEAQEAAKRSEEASIIKRQQAQALMEAADLAIYRATMALRIAEALAAGGSVEPLTGATFGFLAE